MVHPLLRRLLSESEELSWPLVIQAYQERRINLGKADLRILSLDEASVLRSRMIAEVHLLELPS